MMKDHETGWDRTDRLLINLITSMRIQDDPEIRKQCQDMIDKITDPGYEKNYCQVFHDQDDARRI